MDNNKDTEALSGSNDANGIPPLGFLEKAH